MGNVGFADLISKKLSLDIALYYLKLFVNATEKAAYGASKFIGKNDKT